MTLDILCEVPFTNEEERDLAAAATILGMTREEFIRVAVKSFVAECVPTQNATSTAA